MINLLTTLNNVEIINLTPHAINVVGAKTTTFKPSGLIARVSTKVRALGEVGGFPLVQTVFDAPYFPQVPDGTVLIVSAMVLSAAKECRHPLLPRLVAPNTGAAIRNEKGHIIGVPGFTI